MTAPGRSVPNRGLVGVLSATPRKAKKGSSWLGLPPMPLRRAVERGDTSRTFHPPRRLKIARAAGRAVPGRAGDVLRRARRARRRALMAIQAGAGVVAAAVLAGPLLLAAGVVAAGVDDGDEVAAGRPVPGRWSIRCGARSCGATSWPTRSSRCWPCPWLVGHAGGTPLLTAWLRTLGARIGRGVWLETYWLPESDLVRLGDGATVNRGCVVQTHLFHDRIMSMDEVRSTRARRSGPHGIVLPGAGIGAGTTVGPGSLVTRGDAVPAATRWLGNPITTWTLSRKPSGRRGPVDGDSYLPAHGNGGYRVEHYDLDIDYSSRPTGSPGGRCSPPSPTQPLTPVQPRPRRRSACPGCSSTAVRRSSRSHDRRATGKLHVTPARPVAGRFTVEVRYSGNPTPVASRWGDVGWDELTDGALVASQPIGAPSWFPCNDHPADKATYRIAVTTASPLHGRRHRCAHRAAPLGRHDGPGCTSGAEPTASYLVSVQIGRYDEVVLAAGPVPQRARSRPGCASTPRATSAGTARS